MIKKILPLILLLLFSKSSFSQDYKFMYYLNKDFASVNKKDALFIGRGYKEDNLFKLDCFYLTKNAVFMSAHFTDSSLSTMQGLFETYHLNGEIESQGMFINGKEEGPWITQDSTGLLIDSEVYVHNVPKVNAYYSYYDNRNIMFYEITDSINDTYEYMLNDTLGNRKTEISFKGKTGAYKEFDDKGNLINSKTLYPRDKTEAYFVYGKEAYSDFLRRNLDANVPVDNNAPAGKYLAVVSFIVDIDGKVVDVKLEKDPGYGTGQEAFRIIKKSGLWHPATINGIPIKILRRQPLTWVVSEDEVGNQKRTHHSSFIPPGITKLDIPKAKSFESDCRGIDSLYTKPEVPPVFNENFYEYFSKAFDHIDLPDESTLEIAVVIDSVNQPCLLDIIINTGAINNNKLKEMIHNMKGWSAGKNNGKPVNTKIRYLVKVFNRKITITQEPVL